MKITDYREKTISKAAFFIQELKDEVFILGTNKYGEATAIWLLSKGFNFGGFINDYAEITEFLTFKVYKSEELKGDFSIVNCIIEGRAIDAEKNILKLEPKSQIDYFALQFAFRENLPEIDFLGNTDSIAEKIDEYSKIYHLLADEKSKTEFEDITNFRLNRDINCLRNFVFRIKEQYFEPFVKIADDAVFIDGGGYDGETSLIFAENTPNFKKIFYFEPNEPQMLVSKNKLEKFKNIEFMQNGLWNKKETLFFENSLGSASKLSEEGKVKIETISIDENTSEHVDFIKLDIEGAEYNAIIGAKNTIQKYKPELAICVYHNQEDFIRIPKLINEYNPNYKLYLRHYTQGVFETIMYFVN